MRQYQPELNTRKSHKPAVSPQACTQQTRTPRVTYSGMFTAALLVTAHNSIHRGRNKFWHIHTVEYYAAKQKDEQQLHTHRRISQT